MYARSRCLKHRRQPSPPPPPARAPQTAAPAIIPHREPILGSKLLARRRCGVTWSCLCLQGALCDRASYAAVASWVQPVRRARVRGPASTTHLPSPPMLAQPPCTSTRWQSTFALSEGPRSKPHRPRRPGPTQYIPRRGLAASLQLARRMALLQGARRHQRQGHDLTISRAEPQQRYRRDGERLPWRPGGRAEPAGSVGGWRRAGRSRGVRRSAAAGLSL